MQPNSEKGMKIKVVVSALERFAPLPWQDSYDNAGLQVGLTDAEVSGALLCLDVTPEVVDEAIQLGYNLIVSHHPIIFHGLKSITGKSLVECCVMKAIRAGITLYAVHTNLDNAPGGVSHHMAHKLHLDQVCTLLPSSETEGVGAGVIGEWEQPVQAEEFLHLLKRTFGVGCVLHNGRTDHPIRRVALCGGAGAFLIGAASRAGADAFVTGEIKYHDFFEDGGMLLAAIGHYESEQYTLELFQTIIREVAPELPLQFTTVHTNPVNYL